MDFGPEFLGQEQSVPWGWTMVQSPTLNSALHMSWRRRRQGQYTGGGDSSLQADQSNTICVNVTTGREVCEFIALLDLSSFRTHLPTLFLRALTFILLYILVFLISLEAWASGIPLSPDGPTPPVTECLRRSKICRSDQTGPSCRAIKEKKQKVCQGKTMCHIPAQATKCPPQDHCASQGWPKFQVSTKFLK